MLFESVLYFVSYAGHVLYEIRQCEGGGRHYPFGKGMSQLSQSNESLDFKSSNAFQLPISTVTNDANDQGTPLCLSRPEEASEELAVFEQLASAVAKELLLVQHGRARSDSGGVDDSGTVVFPGSAEKFDVATTHMAVNSSKEGFIVRLFSEAGATQLSLTAEELRSRHPKTGDKLEMESDEKLESPSDGMVQHHRVKDHKRPKLMPAKIEKKGRYGYAVEWADGATIIYSMLSIAKAAGGMVSQ